MDCLRRISSQPFFVHWSAFLMYQYHCQMTHTHLALRQWLNPLEGPQIPHEALLQAKALLRTHIFRNILLYRVLNNLLESLIHPSPPLWKINPLNNFRCLFSSLILEITCFKSCLRYLTFKSRMIPASLGCNWEVVFLGKNTSLMFWRFPWRVSGWDGALYRNSKTFRFSTSSLQPKAVRTWIIISVVIHAFLLWKYCIPYGLEGLGNFWKHRGTLLFPIRIGLHTLNALEDTKMSQ